MQQQGLGNINGSAALAQGGVAYLSEVALLLRAEYAAQRHIRWWVVAIVSHFC